MSLTPMLLVEDVPSTSIWLQALFGWKSEHGGPEFEMLADGTGRVVMWLHATDADHDHEALAAVDMRTVGRGITFYVQVEEIEAVFARAESAVGKILEPLHFNELAHHHEFSIAGPHGYQFSAHTAFEGGGGASPPSSKD